MMTVQDLISSMLRDEGGFQKAFKEILDNELHMSLNLEERREPNLRTIRQIIKAINKINRKDLEKFVAVIASPRFMEGLPRSLDTGFNGPVALREYPVSTVEDAIIAAVRAERDGALGIICAPIVANTVEKIISIKVYTVFPLDSVIKILEDVKGDL